MTVPDLPVNMGRMLIIKAKRLIRRWPMDSGTAKPTARRPARHLHRRTRSPQRRCHQRSTPRLCANRPRLLPSNPEYFALPPVEMSRNETTPVGAATTGTVTTIDNRPR